MLTKKEGKHFIKGAIICGEVPWNDFLTGSEWNKIDEYIHNHSDKKSKKFMKKILKKYISYGENFKWRLPTKKELKEAYKNKTKGFRFNRYWSSTTDVSSTSGAWYVNFQNGNAYYSNKYSGFFIRFVRNTKDGLKWNKSSVSEMDHCKAEEFIDFLNTQKH